MMALSIDIFQPRRVFSAAVLLRAGLLVYGRIQDQYSALKYTDIDYYVFTDAARYVSQGGSPYERDTYRYTPLLAWMLVPTTKGGLWFDFGKVLFAASDILAGWLIYQILVQRYAMQTHRALQYASIWLLNPMVAQISTRGSSEGVVAVMIMCLLWACLTRRWSLAGVMLGLSVHFKIYPFIYAASIVWWLDDRELGTVSKPSKDHGILAQLQAFASMPRLKITAWSAVTFLVLNVWMMTIYGDSFLQHTYFYHLIRTDHRHNFSVYNMLLYLNASPLSSSTTSIESLAFLPQLALGLVVLPLKLARRDLASCMLLQTFTFVTFNKVCTSQYFLWYMVFLPFYLPKSSLKKRPRFGTFVLAAWIVGQAAWLQQGYMLEFLGNSAFLPGIYGASLAFFCINIGILGIMIDDLRLPKRTRHA